MDRNDIYKQGFMKPPKKSRITKTFEEKKLEIQAMFGKEFVGCQQGRFGILHAGGHTNWLTYTEAKKLHKILHTNNTQQGLTL